jgi:hypothetical protein
MTNDQVPPAKNWKTPFYFSLLLWGAIAVLLSGYLYSNVGILYAFVSIGLMTLGLKITQALVALMTGLAKANTLGVLIIFTAKLAWWFALFGLSQLVEARFALAIALGVGAFLLSILSTAIWLNGAPKILFVNKRDS